MNIEIDDMTGAQAKKMLKILVAKLDELDGDDYFGSEGWKHYFGLEN